MSTLKAEDFPPTCKPTIPTLSTPLLDLIPRWSYTKIEHPAGVVTPTSEADIIAALHVARQHSLRVVPVGGAHSSFVPIDGQTLYLNMSEFDSLKLDKSAGTVTFGGGILSGKVLRELAEQGYYTLPPSSNSVGMMGFLLGGGTSPLLGMHGYLVDNLVSIRIITFDGRVVEVSADSEGEEKKLFHAICGAGHGLGVYTSATVRAWPLANLGLEDGKNIWTRAMMFPSTELKAVAEAFIEMQPPDRRLSTTLAMVRSPPGTPAPGVPIVALSATFFGPGEEAERAAAPMMRGDLAGKAAMAMTKMIPFEALNDAMPPHSHGGYKGIYSCLLSKIDGTTVQAAFDRWVRVGTEHLDAMPTMALVLGMSYEKFAEIGGTPEGQKRFVGTRNRGIVGMVQTICTSPETRDELAVFCEDMIATYRGNAEESPRTIPNNIRDGMLLEELYKLEMITELKRVKKLWDPESTFWSPYGGDDKFVR